MTEEQRREMILDAKQFYLASPILLPLVQKMKVDAFRRLMAKHRDGDENFGPLVAELAVLDRLETMINQKELTYRTLEEQQHAAGKRS